MKFPKYWYALLLLVAVLSFTQCKDAEDTSYSFFVAGHTYGKPNVNNKGFHPPFKAEFDRINAIDNLKFGVLTGDVVIYSTAQCWDDVDTDLALLNKPVYFAVGNHDMKNRGLFESRYGVTYQSFVQNDDLFIILDPNLDHWNISGAQLDFLKTSLDSNYATVNNIFVFVHQVLWWKPNDPNETIVVNSIQDRADSINYFSTVDPLFKAVPNPVYVFAGDVGATMQSNGYSLKTEANVTYVASGMGGPINSNYVIVEVTSDKEVNIRVVPLDAN